MDEDVPMDEGSKPQGSKPSGDDLSQYNLDDYDNDEAIDEDETQSRVSHKLYVHSIVFF